jgi:hypothetical protein
LVPIVFYFKKSNLEIEVNYKRKEHLMSVEVLESIDVNATKVKGALREERLRRLIRRGSGHAWDVEVRRLSEELSIPTEEVRV